VPPKGPEEEEASVNKFLSGLPKASPEKKTIGFPAAAYFVPGEPPNAKNCSDACHIYRRVVSGKTVT